MKRNNFETRKKLQTLPHETAFRRARRFSELKPSKLVWDQWLAGLIDADGYLGKNKQGQLTCEITTDVSDEPMLREVQRVLGGSVKPRAGSASVRWRTARRVSMLDLCHRINGLVRYDVRQIQFKMACDHLNLPLLPYEDLQLYSGYMAGLWDGDGCITMGVSKSSPARSVYPGKYGKMIRLLYSRGHHQLSIHVDSGHLSLLQTCQRALGFGRIISKNPSPDLKQRRPNLHYRLYWRSIQDVGLWRGYLRKTKAGRSAKHRRLLLLERYFKLKSQGAHLAPENSVLWKGWRNFCHSWYDIKQNDLNSG